MNSRTNIKQSSYGSALLPMTKVMVTIEKQYLYFIYLEQK
jgi:hypothetical protein